MVAAEELAQCAEFFLLDANSGITDMDMHKLWVSLIGEGLDSDAPFEGVFDGVSEDVRKHLSHRLWTGIDDAGNTVIDLDI